MKEVRNFILNHHHCNLTSKNDRYRLTCPYCRNQDNKFYIDFKLGAFWCYHCRTKGGLRFFITSLHPDADISGMDFGQSRIFDFGNTLHDKKAARLPKDFVSFSKNMTLNLMNREYIKYVMTRGFDLDFMIKTRMGYSPAMSYYLIFPVYNELGEYVYWTSRYIRNDGREKTMNPAFEEGVYTKADVLYNLQRASNSSTVYLVEGVIDCLSLAALKYDAVASLGKELSDAQLDILCRLFDTIIVCYDGKALKATIAAADKLLKRGKKVRICVLPDAEDDDPNDLFLNGTIQHYLKQTIEYTNEVKLRLLFEQQRSQNYF